MKYHMKTLLGKQKILIDSNMQNTEIFHHVFRAFNASIEGFNLCWLVLSIDSTHLNGKYKGMLVIAMG